jgi:hypothetical protein
MTLDTSKQRTNINEPLVHPVIALVALKSITISMPLASDGSTALPAGQ